MIIISEEDHQHPKVASILTSGIAKGVLIEGAIAEDLPHEVEMHQRNLFHTERNERVTALRKMSLYT